MKGRVLILAVMLVLGLTFAGCSKASEWKDGTYSGKSEGVHGAIEVNVEINHGKIEKVNIVSEEETEGVSDLALVEIPKAIVEKQSTEVDDVAGASISSKAIKDAVNVALNLAK